MPRHLLGTGLFFLCLAACVRPPRATDGVPAEAASLVDGWLAGAELVVPSPGPAPAVDVRLRALGAEVYRLRCAPCHGVNGNGRGPHAPRLSVPPRDFTTCVYELRSTPSGTLPTDLDLYLSVSRGLRGTAMLPWAWLPELERRAVVEHVKSFCRRFAEEEPGEPFPPSAPPDETPELALRGAAAYERAGCPSCHGIRGNGDGPSAGSLRRDSGAPVRPRPFAGGRFLRGASLADTFLTLETGLDGTPMPSYETVAPDDLWAVAAHVRALSGPPAADRALAADADEGLGRQIDILGR